MKEVKLNSELQYRSGEVIVDLHGTSQGNYVLGQVEEGMSGVSGLPCPLTGEIIHVRFTEKLRKTYDPGWFNFDEMDDEDLEEQDKI